MSITSNPVSHCGSQRQTMIEFSTMFSPKKFKKPLNVKAPTDKSLKVPDDTSTNILRDWARHLRDKYKDERYGDDDIFQDPLLLIEWDDVGIMQRNLNNPQNDKSTLVNLIRAQPGCSQFPEDGVPSDCAFAFDKRQNMANALAILATNAWSKHINGVNDVGRVYSILIPKTGKLDVVEEIYVFNL
ncbi:hypothetical protein C1645_743514 [Glomus cerebriforme]|uniref:Uncharacterized protein n=1 Tax=Glomus cerebriforme TaxID=658196 RepID=A0A397SD55_9GLOM|nr:hypothetical protein C1645_743514 [Glomus cerebriforme]